MSFTRTLAFGVAFKPEHFDGVLMELATIDFFEVHAENYLGGGGEWHRQLHALGKLRPLTIHGVGLSLGGASAPDAHHLQRLRQLLQRHPPQIFSEHLAWSSHGSAWLPDLLPLAYDDDSFIRVAAHIDAAQNALGRRLLIENPATYLALGEPLAEADFLTALHQHTGCGLLLDLNNVVVSCNNHGSNPQAYLRRFTLPAVEQIHLAGHSRRVLDDGSTLCIDDHGSAVPASVLALYAEVLARGCRCPTLIEWDNEVPGWPVLAAELARVRSAASRDLASREAA
jgi:uncharacterized protein (UPF0276 family)